VNELLIYAADFELWARFFQHSYLYGIYSLLGGFRFQKRQKTALHINEYIDEAKQVLSMYRESSQFNEFYLRILHHISVNHFLRRFPDLRKWILKHIGIKPAKNCLWNNNDWEIIENLVL
jgi:hypothetical protein